MTINHNNYYPEGIKVKRLSSPSQELHHKWYWSNIHMPFI